MSKQLKSSVAAKFVTAACMLVVPTMAFAALSELDVQDILVNLQVIINPTLKMLLAVSFVLGVWFIIKGLMLLKSFALPINQATKPGELSGTLLYILVGTVLVYIPTSTDVLSNTLFGDNLSSIFSTPGQPNIYSMGQASDQVMGYASVALESQWATLINTVVYYMQFIGFIAFLRGWIIISHAGQPGAQPEALSKGIIHVIGGILAINFLPLVKAISNTIGGTA